MKTKSEAYLKLVEYSKGNNENESNFWNNEGLSGAIQLIKRDSPNTMKSIEKKLLYIVLHEWSIKEISNDEEYIKAIAKLMSETEEESKEYFEESNAKRTLSNITRLTEKRLAFKTLMDVYKNRKYIEYLIQLKDVAPFLFEKLNYNNYEISELEQKIKQLKEEINQSKYKNHFKKEAKLKQELAVLEKELAEIITN